MEPLLLALGDLVVLFGREGGKGGRVAAVNSVRLVARLDSKSADSFGDAVELLTVPLHSGRKSNVIFLVPTAIIGFNNAMFKFTLYWERSLY